MQRASERWSEATEKGISARRSCSCCRRRRHTTWEKDRERGWESGGRIEQCTGPPRSGGRASDRGRDKSRGEKSNSSQGREKYRRHRRGHGGRGGRGKVRRRPTSQAAAAAVTIICPSPRTLRRRRSPRQAQLELTRTWIDAMMLSLHGKQVFLIQEYTFSPFSHSIQKV